MKVARGRRQWRRSRMVVGDSIPATDLCIRVLLGNGSVHTGLTGRLHLWVLQEIVSLSSNVYVQGLSANTFSHILVWKDMVDEWVNATTKISSRGGKKSPSGNNKRIYGSFSFLGGMKTLTGALCKEIGHHELNLHSKVLKMSYSCDDNAAGNWSIYCAPDQNKQFQQSFGAVIMTVSTFIG
ncbi:hypothetical protein L1987_32426 [Smallanthus sonchifolius]|uniref:Uncharacterized protein n=1 Tax=Smallanthus sonchifolius TaxID=185202 RepID=A0ACB9HP21_9ASTR|nr:hypothetical protein L1987_32426 [Smallanthus sonchifolius]